MPSATAATATATVYGTFGALGMDWAPDSALTPSLVILPTLVLLLWASVRFLQPRRAERAVVADVERKLAQALQTVKDLEQKLLSLEQEDLMGRKAGQREIRIWMDGAFDMMHYGHMNAFRQGRALGTRLIVGVNSDSTITACKGPPVCAEAERLAAVRGCKWVNEVVAGVPYIMSEAYLKGVIEKYKIDYVVHGDDPCIVDGKDVYDSAVKMGKYLTIPRTEGISTTDIVGRMLLLTRSHHNHKFEGAGAGEGGGEMEEGGSGAGVGTAQDHGDGEGDGEGEGMGEGTGGVSPTAAAEAVGLVAVGVVGAEGSLSAHGNTALTAPTSPTSPPSASAPSTTTPTPTSTTPPQRKPRANSFLASEHQRPETQTQGQNRPGTVGAGIGMGEGMGGIGMGEGGTGVGEGGMGVGGLGMGGTGAGGGLSLFVRKSNFLTTSRTVRLFGAGVKAPRPTDRVVYLAGAWDMLHAGHMAVLREARKLGDYVIVGVHSDAEVNTQRGSNLPILNMHERVLSVLGCKWVDDVLIDAPFAVTQEMLQSLRIALVVTSSSSSSSSPPHSPHSAPPSSSSFAGAGAGTGAGAEGRYGGMEGKEEGEGTGAKGAGDRGDIGDRGDRGDRGYDRGTFVDEYAIPRRLNILRVLPCSPNRAVSVLDLVGRIHLQRDRFQEKYQRKAESEQQFFKEKYAVSVV